jgi:predicted nucleic acid-binding protein
MEWVLDSSLALSWVLPEDYSGRADAFLRQRSSEDTFWVPALWWYEISNALLTAQKRNRITEADRIQMVALYALLPIQTDIPFHLEAINRFHELALTYSLTAYDAAYLELALRKGLAIATFDQRLTQAAQKAGITTIPN